MRPWKRREPARVWSFIGLFSSVLHLRDVPRETVVAALDGVQHVVGFESRTSIDVPAFGVSAVPNFGETRANNATYLISPLAGRWITVIEAHFAVPDALRVAENLSIS